MALYSALVGISPLASTSFSAYTRGLQFSSRVAGNAVGVKWYRVPGSGGSVTGDLWTSGGVNLATIAFSGMTSGGWQTQNFSSPVSLTANTTYLISAYDTSGFYETDTAIVFPVNVVLSGPLSAITTAYGGPGHVAPTSTTPSDCYFADIVFDDLGNWPGPPVGAHDSVAEPRVSGYLKGLNLGGMLGPNGSSFGSLLQIGAREEFLDGNPASPCLALDRPGFLRFRWAVTTGTHTISVNTKQVSNAVGMRPSVVVKANPALGVNADVVGTAPSSSTWTTIGPVTVTPSSAGVLYVELWNNDVYNFNSTAYFDHRVVT